MDNTQEITTDIIAEMDRVEVCADGEPCLHGYARRFMAAHKRELSKNVSKNGADFGQLGNMAAMREALIAILEYIESFHKYIIPGKREKMTTLFAVADTIRGKARAALAAPPRNCDKFGGDYKMLHTAWFDWTGSPSGQNPDGTVKLTFAEWLLEIAEVHHA